MTKQFLHIDKYDWDIILFFDTNSCDMPEVLDVLYAMGCSQDRLSRIESLICGPNCGLTYSNSNERHTCIVISNTTSAKEMVNSITHEVMHLIQFLAKENDINLYGEEACYIYGDVIMNIFDKHPDFACEKCYNKKYLRK